MKQETVTVKLNGALCSRIEEFIKANPEYGNLEEFVVEAARILQEQLASTIPPGPATRAQGRDEEYSHSNVHAAWDALNKPLTAEEKTRILKGLVQEFRNLKAANPGAVDRGIQ